MTPAALAAVLRLCARDHAEQALVNRAGGDKAVANLHSRIADLLRETSALVTALSQIEGATK